MSELNNDGEIGFSKPDLDSPLNRSPRKRTSIAERKSRFLKRYPYSAYLRRDGSFERFYAIKGPDGTYINIPAVPFELWPPNERINRERNPEKHLNDLTDYGTGEELFGGTLTQLGRIRYQLLHIKPHIDDGEVNLKDKILRINNTDNDDLNNFVASLNRKLRKIPAEKINKVFADTYEDLSTPEEVKKGYRFPLSKISY